VNRWLARRFNIFSDSIVGIVALVSLLTPSINASLAGFALAFASTITDDMLFLAWRFVGLEQAMVAVERVKEYSDLPREGKAGEDGEEQEAAKVPGEWPKKGGIKCEGLSIRYAVCDSTEYQANFS
jgi:ABC-type multidrug transport system fused ATPase/permease subunit